MRNELRLGINVDHVATIRNARGGKHPDPLDAARIVKNAGADGITAHLREDRRHIVDEDIARLSGEIDLPLNMEMAATEEMLKIALHFVPEAICIVPEKREEKTTEGGLNIIQQADYLKGVANKLLDQNIKVSVFIEPVLKQIDAAKQIGVPVVEFHTGSYCEADGDFAFQEFEKIRLAVTHASDLGLECHAGHGLNFNTASAVAGISEIVELNIGHFLIGEAIFTGLDKVVKRMRSLIDRARIK